MSFLSKKRVSDIITNVLSLFKRAVTVSSLKVRNLLKQPREPSTSSRSSDNLPDVAIAAIASSKKQKEVNDFITFLLTSVERNFGWLNNIVSKQTNFRCALMVGAGPNRFQLQEIIYPCDEKDVKLEVELTEEHDEIAIAALVELPKAEMTYLQIYLKTRLYDNTIMKEDLLKGKAMGISFAILRPFSEKQYRLMERIVIGSSMKCVLPTKRRREDEPLVRPAKRSKRAA